LLQNCASLIRASESQCAAESRPVRHCQQSAAFEGFDVRIVLFATGQPDDFRIASPYFQKEKTWVSLTLFVPLRHAKATRTGVNANSQFPT
jgi:hypothetical protein